MLAAKLASLSIHGGNMREYYRLTNPTEEETLNIAENFITGVNEFDAHHHDCVGLCNSLPISSGPQSLFARNTDLRTHWN